MDIGKSFSYVFDDEKWVQKVVVGALLVLASVIPLVVLFTGFVLAGYFLRLVKNVSDGQEHPLPEWDDWGGDWMRGLRCFAGLLIYSLPGMLVAGVGAAISAVATSGSGDLRGGVQVCFIGLQCLTSLYGLLVSLWTPAVVIRFAREDRFAAMFEFRPLWELIRSHLGDYIVACILAILVKFVAAFGLILCVIGVFLTAFWSMAVQAHLFGQIGAQPAPAFSGPGAPPPGPMAPYGEIVEAPAVRSASEEPKSEG